MSTSIANDTRIDRPRIGLLGGSFDPPHIGHSLMARDALEQAGLDQVLAIPAAIPPHKQDRTITPAGHRLAMARLAFEGRPGLGVLDLELSRGGVSYTVDTVQALRKEQPEIDWVWIIGADTLPELHTWKEIDELLTLCVLLTVRRPGVDRERLAPDRLSLSPTSAALATRDWVDGHGIGISSTDIRSRVARGQTIEWLVDPAVDRYIRDHNLYTC